MVGLLSGQYTVAQRIYLVGFDLVLEQTPCRTRTVEPPDVVCIRLRVCGSTLLRMLLQRLPMESTMLVPAVMGREWMREVPVEVLL